MITAGPYIRRCYADNIRWAKQCEDLAEGCPKASASLLKQAREYRTHAAALAEGTDLEELG